MSIEDFYWSFTFKQIVLVNSGKYSELCSKRTKSEARKIAGFVHLMRG